MIQLLKRSALPLHIKNYLGRDQDFKFRCLQMRFGQWEVLIQPHMSQLRRMVQIGIFQKISSINTRKHQPGCFMKLLLEARKVRLYSERKNEVALILQVMISIFSRRFRSIWKQIQDLSSCKIMLLPTNPSLQQETFKGDRLATSSSLDIHQISI